MPAQYAAPPPELPPLTVAQRNHLLAAKSWWQEGDRSFDYLAENARTQSLLQQFRTLAERLRSESDNEIGLTRSLLHLARQITGNRTFNRSLETSEFARTLTQLLFGEEPLPERLSLFVARPQIGAVTAVHLLYLTFPDRFPFITPKTKAVIAASREQVKQARHYARTLYNIADTVPTAISDILSDFALYESVRRLLGVDNYTDLNGVLKHAGEMPTPAKKRTPKTIREEKTTYQTETTEPGVSADERDLLQLIESEIAGTGFRFAYPTVRNYYIALKAKPFVILTGLSGTGKTRLTRLLADALTGNIADQYLLMPVRPDWHDSTALLGYHNLLTDRYIGTPFLEILHRAAQLENRERTFFLCLDEMNLARVEHYFAEILSAMETDEQQILLHEGRKTVLSPNLFLTGSVNMDEATYPFSRKVLDRANTIEFTTVDFRATEHTLSSPLSIPSLERQRIFLGGCVRTVQAAQARLDAIDKSFVPRIVAILSDLNERLSPRQLHFGYRVRDEILRYIAASFTMEGYGLLADDATANLQMALDLQIVQKVLPRMTGTSEALERLLLDLTAWAALLNLPLTATKLERMRHRATEDGFVTFYEM